MKKIFLIFLIINLILPAAFAYAEVMENPRINSTQTDKVQIAKEKKELRILQSRISSNWEKLAKMKKDANNSFNKAKNKIQQLLKKKNNMTQKQIDLLNEAIMSLQIDSKALNDTSENLYNMNLNLENAKKGTNYELIKTSMNEVISWQKISINKLRQAIIDMNRIAKM